MPVKYRKVMKYDDVYKYCCIKITLLEQYKLFGTMGLANILKKYSKAEAIVMAKNYINLRDDDLILKDTNSKR